MSQNDFMTIKSLMSTTMSFKMRRTFHEQSSSDSLTICWNVELGPIKTSLRNRLNSLNVAVPYTLRQFREPRNNKKNGLNLVNL